MCISKSTKTFAEESGLKREICTYEPKMFQKATNNKHQCKAENDEIEESILFFAYVILCDVYSEGYPPTIAQYLFCVE